MSEGITSNKNSQSMYTNTDLALKLNAERRRVCGILGVSRGYDCPVFEGRGCFYAVRDKSLDGAVICTLKQAAMQMMPPTKAEEVQHEQI